MKRPLASLAFTAALVCAACNVGTEPTTEPVTPSLEEAGVPPFCNHGYHVENQGAGGIVCAADH